MPESVFLRANKEREEQKARERAKEDEYWDEDWDVESDPLEGQRVRAFVPSRPIPSRCIEGSPLPPNYPFHSDALQSLDSFLILLKTPPCRSTEEPSHCSFRFR